MNLKTLKLFIAIPAMDECAYLPQTLHCIASQKTKCSFEVYVCINQPDEWWNQPDKLPICERNQQLLNELHLLPYTWLHVLDYSSKGKGWTTKRQGVGWARKILFHRILQESNEHDVLISLDADTTFSENYFQSIFNNFQNNPDLQVISVPYYHSLIGDEQIDKAILRYEIFLRNYFLNMQRIKSPYTFTAIGSAIALKISVLKKVGGITPMQSGEDFYFLQKLRKMTEISNYNSERVYPAARLSDRVPFGTGPAIKKGVLGDWSSYPIFHHKIFDKIAETYHLIPQLFYKDIPTDFMLFLQQQFGNRNFLQALRNNFKDLPHFTRAFHEKVDGLRILQFLKSETAKSTLSEEENLLDNCFVFGKNGNIPAFLYARLPQQIWTVEQWNELRDWML
jgi:glycosyltransferase involved in cell wall biosynthesis